MDCSLPGSFVHGILQARILEWVAITPFQGIFPAQGLNPGLLHCRQILYHLSHQGRPKFPPTFHISASKHLSDYFLTEKQDFIPKFVLENMFTSGMGPRPQEAMDKE